MPGIALDKVKAYWEKRSAKHGERTVGPNNWPAKRQDELYATRQEFVKTRMPCDKLVLDYGCGTGRYSGLFVPSKYLGMDVCERLLSVAKQRNPEHRYELYDLGTDVNETRNMVKDRPERLSALKNRLSSFSVRHELVSRQTASDLEKKRKDMRTLGYIK